MLVLASKEEPLLGQASSSEAVLPLSLEEDSGTRPSAGSPASRGRDNSRQLAHALEPWPVQIHGGPRAEGVPALLWGSFPFPCVLSENHRLF